MIFRTVNADAKKLTEQLGLLNKSFRDIKKDFSNGLGFTNSLFRTSISKTDYQALQKFNSAIKATNDGLTKSQRITKAWNENMSGCSIAAKRMGNDLITGKKTIQDVEKTMGEASASTKAFGIAMNIVANVGFMLVITAITKVISELAQAQEKAVQVAKEATVTYKSELDSIADYKQKLSELHEELKSGNLSYEETKTKRTELMSIQDELIEKFGTEKDAIESVTAAINGQVDALNELNEKAYRDWVAKSDGQTVWGKLLPWGKSGLDQAIDYMETEKTVSFHDMRNANLNDDIQAIQKEIDETIQSKYGLDKTLAMFNVTGTPDEIKSQLEAIRQDYLDLSKDLFLENGVSSEMWEKYREESIDSINKLLNQLDNGLDKHQKTYQTYIEGMIKYDSEYSDEYATILQKRAALESAENAGNAEEVTKAKQEFMDAVQGAIEASGSNENVKKYFQSLYPELQAEFANWNFEFGLSANTDGINDIAKEIGEKYTATDLLNMVNDDSAVIADKAFNSLIDKAIEYGICTDKSAQEVQKLIDLLVELGIVQGDVQGSPQSEEPTNLFTQLTSSQESLDKFQSAVKSAQDAYTTLLSGNYSTSELLDSIQTISQSVKDMGGSLDLESIFSKSDSLGLLGAEIERISQEYAESIGMGGDFGQMLSNIIQEAYKSEAQLSSLNTQIDSLQSAYSDLTDIVDAYNETGYITLDQLQILLAMDSQYLSCLIDENGQLQLNESAMAELANQRLNDAEAQAVQQAITELGQLALQDEKQAVEENATAFTNAVDDLASYNTELANTIAEATVGASAIRDLNAAISGAEAKGATDDQINTVLDNLNTKLQLIGNVRNKVASGGLGAVAKSGNKGSSKDEYLEQYKKELGELERAHDFGLISDEEYWKARIDLNERYFGISSGKHRKYLSEYQDNEKEILEGIKNLWKGYYTDRKNDLSDLISYAEKLYDKQIDGLNEQKSQIEENRDAEEEYWKSQIESIQTDIDLLEDANSERQKMLDLQQKQFALQRAMQQHTILLYTESSGMVYRNDTKAERDARNDLADAQHDVKISDLKKQQESLQKQLDAILKNYDAQIESIERQISSLQKVKSAWSDIAANQELKELEERRKTIFGDDVKDKILSGNTAFVNSIVAQYSATSEMLSRIENATLTDIQNMVAQYGILPENLMPITGMAAEIKEALGNIDTSGFNANLDNTAKSAANAAEKVHGATTALNDYLAAFQANLSGVIGAEESMNTQSSGTKGGKKSAADSGADTIVGAVQEGGALIDQALNGEKDSWTSSFMNAFGSIHNTAAGIVECIESMVSSIVNACVAAINAINMMKQDEKGDGNSPAPSAYKGNGHAALGKAYASGIKGTKKDEKNAVVSEYGQEEMVVFPSGETVITDTPTAMDLPKGTVVYNEEETEKILKNKVTPTGSTYAGGTDDGWFIGKDGHRYRPIRQGDHAWEMMQKFEPLLEKIKADPDYLVSNAMIAYNRQMEKIVKQINYANVVTNNKNVQPVVNQTFNITLPNVTNTTSAEVLMRDLQSLATKKFQVNW